MSQQIHFLQETDGFYEEVKRDVATYLKKSSSGGYATKFFYTKALLLIGIYISLYIILLYANQSIVALTAMVLMGPIAIFIGINVAHDAAHGSIAKKQWMNNSFLLLFDFLGANSYIWKKRHVFSHHIFPNILNADADLKQNPMVRIFPNDEKRGYHRYQFIYAPFLYLLYTINWLFFRDFQDFQKKEIGSLKLKRHKKLEYFKLIFYKIIYVSYILIFPLLFSSLNGWQLLLGFLLMNFAASITITLALIPSHVAEDSAFPIPDESGQMATSWSHHQLHTIRDFATSNWFLNFLFGGFNHHLAHHLFPNICHVHYVKITPIIKASAKRFGLTYNHEASFFNAYLSHYKLLKKNGIQMHLSEVA
ncbi:acyl-CoA desaturase [Algoriphagus sp.]|uniref:fatty acid desaturase family protein n=1 Tax=Algoriphagus sp. TaxID=1872435 RepID=UPI0025CCFDDC|nr:acyl-CoA desaturase [Algoriphagus sp.]